MFENRPKKSHSTLRAKRATFTFWVDKSSLKMAKTFWNPGLYGQTVLPDRSLLIGQKLVKNAKINYANSFTPIEKKQMRHFWWFSNTVLEDGFLSSLTTKNRTLFQHQFDLNCSLEEEAREFLRFCPRLDSSALISWMEAKTTLEDSYPHQNPISMTWI